MHEANSMHERDLDQGSHWILTPKVIVLVDIIVFIIKLFLISIDLIADGEAVLATALICVSFALKIFICLCFLLSKNDLSHNAFPCYLIRLIYDMLIIVSLTLYFTITSQCHFITAITVGLLLVISESIIFTCCVNDARKYSKWLLQNGYSQQYNAAKQIRQRRDVIDAGRVHTQQKLRGNVGGESARGRQGVRALQSLDQEPSEANLPGHV